MKNTTGRKDIKIQSICSVQLASTGCIERIGQRRHVIHYGFNAVKEMLIEHGNVEPILVHGARILHAIESKTLGIIADILRSISLFIKILTDN